MRPPGNDEARPVAGAGLQVESPGEGIDGTSVRHGADNVTAHRYPAAFASRYRPNAERRCWWIAYRCPRCNRAHFGRSNNEIMGGLRRARCGRLVWVVIARTYGEAA